MTAANVDQWLTRYGQVPDRRRRGAWAGVWLLLVALYVGLYAMPNVEARDEADAALAAAQQKKGEAEHFAGDYARVAADFKANQARLDSLHEVLPDDPDVPQFLGRLGAMAKGLDVSIERLEPKPELAHEFYAELTLGVQVRGSFHQIATLIDQISNLPRIVAIRHVTLSDPKTHDQRIIIEGQFDVSVYRFLSEAQQKALAEQKAKTP